MLQPEVNVYFQLVACSHDRQGKAAIGAAAGEQTVEVVDAVQESSAYGYDPVAGPDARLRGRSARLHVDDLDRPVVEQVQVDDQPPGATPRDSSCRACRSWLSVRSRSPAGELARKRPRHATVRALGDPRPPASR